MSHTITKALFLIPIVLSMASCGKSDLDRATAKDLLSKHAVFSEQTTDVRLDTRCLYEQGYLVDGSFGVGSNLTPVAQKIFHRASPDLGLYDLKKPISIKLKEITGISGDNQNKSVQFTYEYSNAPSIVNQCPKSPKEFGMASFRIFDDGWRVTHASLHCKDENCS